MPGYTGYVDNSSMLAHRALLAQIKTLAEANNWVTLRYDTANDNHELILKGPGLSGTEEIFVGLYTYQDVGADYYNLAVATMTGYLSGNTFATQPGISPILGVPAHNQRIDYWININGQRIAAALKVGTPVYESFYLGKFFPYALPNQYPQPLIAAGMLTSATATRFSDTSHSMPYKGNRGNLRMRFNDGAWQQPYVIPYSNTPTNVNIGSSIRPANTTYVLHPAVLHNNQTALGSCNVWGELDGIYHITGFDNAVENTLTINGKNYVVIQDVWRTGFGDYYALEMS